MKVLVRTATSPNLDDPTLLDALIRTEGWQTFMTFTRETIRKYWISYTLPVYSRRPPASRPAASAPSGSTHAPMDEDIPPEVFDQIARESGGQGNGFAAGGANERVCPHCTFVNAHGGSDCEICGLPLQG